MSLKPPPRALSSLSLATRTVPASALYRVSRFASGEPFFGRTASNRFDDRSLARGGRFGTCYFGLDLQTAIAETVLHDAVAVRGKFSVPWDELASRQLVRLKGGAPLVLADLTGVALKTLGGEGSLSTITPYRLAQSWAMAVHRHPQQVDGILYMSRHLNDRQAVVVFDRAGAKLGTATYTPLPRARGVMEAVAGLRISFDYP